MKRDGAVVVERGPNREIQGRSLLTALEKKTLLSEENTRSPSVSRIYRILKGPIDAGISPMERHG